MLYTLEYKSSPWNLCSATGSAVKLWSLLIDAEKTANADLMPQTHLEWSGVREDGFPEVHQKLIIYQSFLLETVIIPE